MLLWTQIRYSSPTILVGLAQSVVNDAAPVQCSIYRGRTRLCYDAVPGGEYLGACLNGK